MQVIIRDKTTDEVIIDFTETERQIVESEVVSFKEWLKAGPLNIMRDKVLSVEKRLHQKYMPILAKTHETMPTNHRAISELILKHPEFKTRKEVDAELERAKKEKKPQEKTGK